MVVDRVAQLNVRVVSEVLRTVLKVEVPCEQWHDGA